MRKIAIFILLITTVMGCSNMDGESGKKTIFVTITPLKSIIADITRDDFTVEVLVPEGVSPETYDPTAKQLTAASDAEMIFSTGLINFEKQLVERLANKTEVVDLSQGIEVMAGCCSHGDHKHTHGIDPHIWTSPRALQTMTRTAYSAIKRLYPDSAKYDIAAEALITRLEELDNYCKETIEQAGVDVVMIYHPAYTYYARDYGINQIAIEQDGKDPSPRQLTNLVERAKKSHINAILIQPQYDINKVRSIAEECGAEIIVTDPLAEDIINEIRSVTNTICQRHE